MTLGTIENKFAEKLLAQLAFNHEKLNLSGKGAVVDLLLPNIIMATLQYEDNPEREIQPLELAGYSYRCFKNISEAQSSFPGITLAFEGWPYKFHEFIYSTHETAIINLAPLGSVILSKNKSHFSLEGSVGLHNHVLPLFLNYALGKDLWGPQGKWIRIHEKIFSVLETSGLLIAPAQIGYYPLDIKAAVLERSNILGTLSEKEYSLILPWSFPLSAISKLTTSLQQGL